MKGLLAAAGCEKTLPRVAGPSEMVTETFRRLCGFVGLSKVRFVDKHCSPILCGVFSLCKRRHCQSAEELIALGERA